MSKAVTRAIAPFLLVAVVIAVMFGFLVMMTGSGHMTLCFDGAADAGCAALTPLAHFEAHFQTFQQISTAVVQSSFALFAVLLLLLIGAIQQRPQEDSSGTFPLVARRSTFDISPQRIQYMHWLALREKRDPSRAYAMN